MVKGGMYRRKRGHWPRAGVRPIMISFKTGCVLYNDLDHLENTLQSNRLWSLLSSALGKKMGL